MRIILFYASIRYSAIFRLFFAEFLAPAPHEVAYQTNKRRLKERLDQYGLVEYVIKGDGNCQFASVAGASCDPFHFIKRRLSDGTADQLYQSPEAHR
jgi:hypothetical protein